tara:strand:- start:800 stop:1060 length:261 start_codon:yes stop_codon:yes gene_type:complete
MKAGQIVKVTPKALSKFAPGIRKRLDGAIGLVVQEKYDLSYKIDQDRLPERVKLYPASVQFSELEDIMGCENNTIMLFASEAEVLS